MLDSYLLLRLRMLPGYSRFSLPITARLSDSVSPRSMATSTPGRLATAEPAFRKIWNRHYSIGQLFDIVTREVYITLTRGILLFVVSMAHIMRIRRACAMRPCSEVHKTEQNPHSQRMGNATLQRTMTHTIRIRSVCAMQP